MQKTRLDQAIVKGHLTESRSQAESYIKLGYVTVDGRVVTKPGFLVMSHQNIKVTALQQYVSRAALKLASVAEKLQLNFKDKTVLDVGSSTGGFTDYALRHGAQKVIAVDVGTQQMHPKLREDPRIELHEQTDIRDVRSQNSDLRNANPNSKLQDPSSKIHIAVPDMVLIDVSFISLEDILPTVHKLSRKGTDVVAMVKPQFEAGASSIKHKGVIKNEHMRRDILKHFERWVQKLFVIVDKGDSEVQGSEGNHERFYLLRPLAK